MGCVVCGADSGPMFETTATVHAEDGLNSWAGTFLYCISHSNGEAQAAIEADFDKKVCPIEVIGRSGGNPLMN